MFTFFDMMASNMILTQLVLALVCPTHLDHKSSWVPQLLPECNDTSKSFISEGTDWLDIIARDNSIASIATTFTFTMLGDVLGRKPIALLAAGALCLDKLFMALSPNPSAIHYAHAVCGLFGSMNLYFAFMYSAMADISGLSRRSKDFAWVEAALYLGVSIGPYVGGLLANKFGIQMPFYISSFGFLIIFLYILTIQETLPKDKRTRLVCRLKICQLNSSETEQNGEDQIPLNLDQTVLGDGDESSPVSDSGPLQSKTEPIPKETKWWMITPVGVLIIFTQSWNWIMLLSLFFFTMFEQGGYIFIISLYAKYKFDWGAYQIVRRFYSQQYSYC
jgi:MFS family permease